MIHLQFDVGDRRFQDDTILPSQSVSTCIASPIRPSDFLVFFYEIYIKKYIYTRIICIYLEIYQPLERNINNNNNNGEALRPIRPNKAPKRV